MYYKTPYSPTGPAPKPEAKEAPEAPITPPEAIDPPEAQPVPEQPVPEQPAAAPAPALTVNTHSKVGRSLIQKWATRERMQS